MTVAELSRTMRSRLAPYVGEREAAWMVRTIWESLKGWSSVDLALNGSWTVTDYIIGKFESIAGRVALGEPLQYILGSAYFYGMTFKVTPSTLIPRPETAELVDIIVDRYRMRSDLRVLDAGTGSGCIAIALSRNLPFSKVTAIDISPEAIDVARENAKLLRATVDFAVADILSLDVADNSLYDIIVSNPPYIAMKERAEMSPTVKDHEPSAALFVPDDDALRFYHALCGYASHALARGGGLFFELNPVYAHTLADEMKRQGCWSNIEVRRDMYGKERFLSAMRE